MRKSAFAGYHPAVNAAYFLLVLTGVVCWMHPLALGVSAVCAAGYAAVVLTPRVLGRRLLWLLPVMGLAAVINPAFNHRGATVLAYLPSGNPLTLESLAYGLAAAGMLAAVLLWCACLHQVLDTEKILYLLGRPLPTLSLVLAMALGFVPRFREQAQKVAQARKAAGREVSRRRLQEALARFSILVTWALETAVETADSLAGRGCGLPGRTAFSPFCLERRDLWALAFLLLGGGFVLWRVLGGSLAWQWFPRMGGLALGPGDWAVLAVYGAVCALPLILEGKEAWLWRRSRSKI